MKEIFIILLVAQTIAVCIVVYLSMHKFNKLIEFTTSIARHHNTATYNFARFIVANLNAEAKRRELTDDEKEFFQQARGMINCYEELKKDNNA